MLLSNKMHIGISDYLGSFFVSVHYMIFERLLILIINNKEVIFDKHLDFSMSYFSPVLICS